jgi:hypothetical protein
MSDRWTTPDQDPRTYGNPVDELPTFREYLDNFRLTIELKCEGASTPTSSRVVPCRRALSA